MGIVSVCPADLIDKFQIQYLRTLAKIPVIRLTSGQTGTMNSGLLSGADTDRLTAFGKAYGIGLSIF